MVRSCVLDGETRNAYKVMWEDFWGQIGRVVLKYMCMDCDDVTWLGTGGSVGSVWIIMLVS